MGCFSNMKMAETVYNEMLQLAKKMGVKGNERNKVDSIKGRVIHLSG